MAPLGTGIDVSNQGWIKLHRKLQDNVVFDNEKALKVWIWCLLKATHTEIDCLIGRQKVHLKRGQFIFGRKIGAEKLKFKPSTVGYWISFLKANGYIDIQSTNKYSIITIQNWNRYQRVNSQTNNRRTTDGQQTDTYKNVLKNDKECKRISIYHSGAKSVAGQEISNIIKLFGNLNPNYERLFKNKTQRIAVKRMLKKMGQHKLDQTIQYAISVQTDKFAPSITTPCQLEDKLGALINHYYRQKNDKKKFQIL